MITLELSVALIGGPDGYPKHFGPWVSPATLTGLTSVVLDARGWHSYLYARVELSNWVQLSDGWFSVHMTLYDTYGSRIGRRPALIYGRHHDVPSVTSFFLPDGGGMFAVSARCTNVT